MTRYAMETTPLFEMYRGDDHAFKMVVKNTLGASVPITRWRQTGVWWKLG